MCRNIKTLFNFDPPVTPEEVRAASLQFVRKISGFTKPSKANEVAFQAAIDEIARVLIPGGRLLSLDFNRPAQPLLRAAYLLYLTAVGSTLGFVLHRDPDTYRYIPESIRNYPGAEGVARLLERRGFTDVRVMPLLGGLMAIHTATRSG